MVRCCMFTSVNSVTKCKQRGYECFALYFVCYLPLNMASERPTSSGDVVGNACSNTLKLCNSSTHGNSGLFIGIIEP
jgi:hypothetical protein